MDHALVNAATEMDVPAHSGAVQSLRLVSFDLHSTVCDVLNDYRPGSLVSTGMLCDRVRNLLPLLEISDADLSNAIAEQALNTGHTILFEASR